MSDVEIAQLTPAAAPVSKKTTSWSRVVVALAAAVAASTATAYAVRHKNRSGDSQVSLQRRLELSTCVPEFDCDLFSKACLRIDTKTENCDKRYFGEGQFPNLYGSKDKCLEQNGVNGFITHWCPEKQLLAGCNSANRCTFRKEATGRIISKGKNNDDCKKPGAEECPTYAKLRDDAMKVISSPPPSPQLAVQVSCSDVCPFGMDDGVFLAGDELDVHGTHLFTKDGYPNWRIRNDFGCGWKLEDDFNGDWESRANTFKDHYKEKCSECTGLCSTEGALMTDKVYYDNGETDVEDPMSGVSLALGYYDGETFTPFVLAVQVSVSADAIFEIAGMAGVYLAGELDEYGTHVFAKDDVSTLGATWRIRNSECGWKIEEDVQPGFGPVPGWTPRATTQCSEESECTGSCRTEEALTTDEDVPGYSLALGYYAGGTFVAA